MRWAFHCPSYRCPRVLDVTTPSRAVCRHSENTSWAYPSFREFHQQKRKRYKTCVDLNMMPFTFRARSRERCHTPRWEHRCWGPTFFCVIGLLTSPVVDSLSRTENSYGVLNWMITRGQWDPFASLRVFRDKCGNGHVKGNAGLVTMFPSRRTGICVFFFILIIFFYFPLIFS